MGNKKEREYLVAVSIEAGIITLIEPDGRIGFYRQRGIQRLNPLQIQKLVQSGLLNHRWREAKELPSNWSICFEDEEIMGKARATFPLPKEMRGTSNNGTKHK